MNRERKYRVWDKSKQAMISDQEHVIGMDGALLEWFPDNWWVRDPETYELIEFTGLYDKNGKEIYEGDIAESKGHRLIFTIEYRLSMGGFMACSEGLLMGLGQHADILEVIGNIYENPGLI